MRIDLWADGRIGVNGKVVDINLPQWNRENRSRDPGLREGDTAYYRGGFGGGSPKRCTILGIDEKDGKKVYDCRLDNGEERWGYADQFSR
jgi:hypothetical protein